MSHRARRLPGLAAIPRLPLPPSVPGREVSAPARDAALGPPGGGGVGAGWAPGERRREAGWTSSQTVPGSAMTASHLLQSCRFGSHGAGEGGPLNARGRHDALLTLRIPLPSFRSWMFPPVPGAPCAAAWVSLERAPVPPLDSLDGAVRG